MGLTTKQAQSVIELDYMFHKTDSYDSNHDKDGVFYEYRRGEATMLKGLERRGVVESITIYHNGCVDLIKGRHWDFWLDVAKKQMDKELERIKKLWLV